MAGHNVNVSVGDSHTTEFDFGTCLVLVVFGMAIIVIAVLSLLFSVSSSPSQSEKITTKLGSYPTATPTPTPEPTPQPTLDPFAHVIIVQAEANADSQGVDDTIRLEEARTNNQVKLMTVEHEQGLESRSQLAWFGLPYSIIALGGFTFALILLIRFTNK